MSEPERRQAPLPPDEALPAEAAAQPDPPADEALPAEPPAPQAPPARAPRPPRPSLLAEPPEQAIEVPRRRLASQSRRDFLLLAAGVLATATGAWWLLPDRARARLLPGPARDRLDTLAAPVG